MRWDWMRQRLDSMDSRQLESDRGGWDVGDPVSGSSLLIDTGPADFEYATGDPARAIIDPVGTMPATPAARVARPIRVGIVDDHAMVAESLRVLLGGQPDFEIVGIAGTVAGAIALVDRFRPHVVLVDYRLPDGDGAAARRFYLRDGAIHVLARTMAVHHHRRAGFRQAAGDRGADILARSGDDRHAPMQIDLVEGCHARLQVLPRLTPHPSRDATSAQFALS